MITVKGIIGKLTNKRPLQEEKNSETILKGGIFKKIKKKGGCFLKFVGFRYIIEKYGEMKEPLFSFRDSEKKQYDSRFSLSIEID